MENYQGCRKPGFLHLFVSKAEGPGGLDPDPGWRGRVGCVGLGCWKLPLEKATSPKLRGWRRAQNPHGGEAAAGRSGEGRASPRRGGVGGRPVPLRPRGRGALGRGTGRRREEDAGEAGGGLLC